uniref:Uncharacterized protein n=1 Tax=Brassica campestris TaxID=3711 RepID=A0A3P5ZDV3_BRACM|nr:unnamed protein product [Brassica rapa]
MKTVEEERQILARMELETTDHSFLQNELSPTVWFAPSDFSMNEVKEKMAESIIKLENQLP